MPVYKYIHVRVYCQNKTEMLSDQVQCLCCVSTIVIVCIHLYQNVTYPFVTDMHVDVCFQNMMNNKCKIYPFLSSRTFCVN